LLRGAVGPRAGRQPASRLPALPTDPPGHGQGGPGTIVNISSVAGKRGWANASADARSDGDQPPAQAPQDALAPQTVADLIAFIAGAPPELVLTEAVVAPLFE
jgi:NADP-dependent 3-hydroxy acid dehydrogenase YdfG